MKTISFIGAGNVATQLSLEFQKNGISVKQIWSKTEEKAKELASKLNCRWTINLNEIEDVDLIIVSVKDDFLEEVIENLNLNNSPIVHTSGSIGLDVFKNKQGTGILYPLQTFSKFIPMNLTDVPFCIESENKEFEKKLTKIAHKISNSVHLLSTEKRKKLHLAAVFACNFSNHMLSISEKIMKENDLDFEMLKPLILQTFEKIKTNSPNSVQTGPAIRKDYKVIKNQIDSLNSEELKQIYKQITNNIIKLKNDNQ